MIDRGFAPIRRDVKMGTEWLDLRGFFHEAESASLYATTIEKKNSDWAAEYLFVRLAAVVVMEESEYETLVAAKAGPAAGVDAPAADNPAEAAG